MRKFLFLFLAIESLNLQSQKNDYIWMWHINSLPDPGIENNVLDFNNGIRTLKRDTALVMNDQVNASMSDDEGNLLFYFNGCTIVSADHQLIENGDSINYDEDWWLSIADCKYGYTGQNNTIIVQDPINENGYYIFHKTIEYINYKTKIDAGILGLKYSYVDMNENNRKGRITKKNMLINKDTIVTGYLHAVKHNNGKDWWLIDLKETQNEGTPTNKHIIYLLSSTGPTVHSIQHFGPNFSDNSSSCGGARFSPDGNKWVYYCKRDGLWMLDFNRETGVLSNYKYHNISHEKSAGGLEWSGNSRFLYISTLDSLFQYDTWAEDLKSSEKLVDVWDGSSNPFQTVFAKMQRGPDCRIYMSSRSSTRSIHVINNPDEPVPFCNFEQHGLKLFSSTGTISMPTFPNYRLDTAPVCDPSIVTSSKDIEDLPKTDINVYPNPASDLFYVESSYQYKDVSVEIIDMNGKIWWKGEHHRAMSFSAYNFPAGVYVVRMKKDGRVLGMEKLVVAPGP